MFEGDYFRPVAEEVFSETLLRLDARRSHSRILKTLENFARNLQADGSGVYTLGTRGLTDALQAKPAVFTRTVCYETSDWFVELFEYPGEQHAHAYDGKPCHYLHIDIGPLPERSTADRMIAIDILNTLPPDSPLRENRILWRYKNMEEMRDVFIRARDEIFIPFSIPLLLDKLALTEFLERLAELRDAQWHAEIAAHNASIIHASAERAYQARNFLKYLAEMGEIPPERLSKVDLARIAYASKRVRG